MGNVEDVTRLVVSCGAVNAHRKKQHRGLIRRIHTADRCTSNKPGAPNGAPLFGVHKCFDVNQLRLQACRTRATGLRVSAICDKPRRRLRPSFSFSFAIQVLYHSTGRLAMVGFGFIGFCTIFCGMLLFTISSPHFYWYAVPTFFTLVNMCCHCEFRAVCGWLQGEKR